MAVWIGMRVYGFDGQTNFVSQHVWTLWYRKGWWWNIYKYKSSKSINCPHKSLPGKDYFTKAWGFYEEVLQFWWYHYHSLTKYCRCFALWWLIVSKVIWERRHQRGWYDIALYKSKYFVFPSPISSLSVKYIIMLNW